MMMEIELKEDLDVLHQWWDEARDGRAMPDRTNFDPLERPHLIPKLIMVRTSTKLRDFEFLVYGGELAQQFGEDRTGKRFEDVSIDQNKETTLSGYWSVYTTSTPSLFTGRHVSDDKHFMLYDRLLLPLGPVDQAGRPTRILGIIAFYPAA